MNRVLMPTPTPIPLPSFKQEKVGGAARERGGVDDLPSKSHSCETLRQQIQIPKRGESAKGRIDVGPGYGEPQSPGAGSHTPSPTSGVGGGFSLAATPRGCRFPSLNEAHRNITGRSATSDSTQHTASSSLGSANNDSAIGIWTRPRNRKDSSATNQDSSSPLEPAKGADAHEDIPLQDLSPTGERLSTVSESTPAAHQSSSRADRDRDRDSSPDAPSIEQGRSRCQSLRASDTQQDCGSLAASASRHSSFPAELSKPAASMSAAHSGSTVDRIFDQYRHGSSDAATPGDANGGKLPGLRCVAYSSSQGNLSAADLSELRAQAAARCGFRSDDEDQSFDFGLYSDLSGSEHNTAPGDGLGRRRGNGSKQMGSRTPRPRLSPPGEAPMVSLPKIPNGSSEVDLGGAEYFGSAHAVPFGQSPTSSLSDSQGLLNCDLGDENDDLYPPPLTLRSRPPNKSPLRKSYLSAGATSVGATTESDDDPFKYDRGSYGVFMASRKEREVSAALHRMSTVSRTSRVTLGSPEKLSPYKTAFGRPPMPQLPLARIVEHVERSRNDKPDNSKLDAFHFLDPKAVKSNWEVDETHCAVKVSVLPAPGAAARLRSQKELPESPHALTAKKLKVVDEEQQSQRTSVASSDRDEWETVPTARGPLNSIGLSFPRGRHQSGGIMKTTGSSIANISDYEEEQTSVCQSVPFDDCASTDRIIQHPAKDGEGPGFKVRHLKDSAMPIFLPKQRVHKVNGFAQNSLRMLPDAGTKTMSSSSPSAIAGKIQDKFSQLNRKRRRNSPFPMLAESAEDDPRTGYRDSMYSNTSEIGLGGHKGLSGRAGGGKQASHERPGRDVEAGGHHHPNRPDADHDLADNELSISSTDTAHSFGFPLIPLPEAARIQAVRRASGQEDHTVSKNDLGWRHDSFCSSVKTNGSTFKSAKLPRVPERVHRRVPTPLHTPEPRPASQSPEDHGPPSPLSSQLDSSPERSGRRTYDFDDSTAALGASPTWGKRVQGRRWPARGMIASSTPRLCPWDRRRHEKADGDPTLRALAGMGLAQGSLPLTYMSYEGQKKQRRWFILMLFLCIFPFLSVLIYLGQFDNALSWYSQGEVNRLTPFQRRVILVMMILQFFIWPPLIVLVVRKLSGMM